METLNFSEEMTLKSSIEISLNDIFKNPKFQDLAKVIQEQVPQEMIFLEPLSVLGDYPMSSQQKRMFVLEQLVGHQLGYNRPAALLLEGTIDLAVFKNTVEALIKRHEALRTSFSLQKEAFIQTIHPHVSSLFVHLTIPEKEIAETIHIFKKPFNLSQAPLFRTALLQLSANKALFLFDIHHIISDGVSIDILILDPSFEAVMAIFAILKIGAVFIPLDPSYPSARIQAMLEDASVEAVLTLSYLVNHLSFFQQDKLICLDSLHDSLARESEDNVALSFSPQALAYILYTSGSTGKPKGVMITHEGLFNYLYWAKEHYHFGPKNGLLFSSLAFDLTLTSLFLPLLCGDTLHIHPWKMEKTYFTTLASRKDLELIKLTPSHLNVFLETGKICRSLKQVIVGGEAFKSPLAEKLIEKLGPDVAIFNEYGPTEATVGCMIYLYQHSIDNQQEISIGKPIANMEVYLLDDNLKPVLPHHIGEMYIGGKGLARGYLNAPDLTAEKFLPHPFKPGQRLYRTGDLAKWSSDGNLMFLGRKDHLDRQIADLQVHYLSTKDQWLDDDQAKKLLVQELD